MRGADGDDGAATLLIERIIGKSKVSRLDSPYQPSYSHKGVGDSEAQKPFFLATSRGGRRPRLCFTSRGFISRHA